MHIAYLIYVLFMRGWRYAGGERSVLGVQGSLTSACRLGGEDKDERIIATNRMLFFSFLFFSSHINTRTLLKAALRATISEGGGAEKFST